MQFAQRHHPNRKHVSQLHVTAAEETEVLHNNKSDDGNTASTSGGSSGSNSEINAEDRTSLREKKQPSWVTSGEFVRQVNDSQGGYCQRPISYTEAMQSNEKKQWLKAMNEELASLKENVIWGARQYAS